MSLSQFFLQTVSCLTKSCFLSPPHFFWESFSLLLIIFWIITKLIGREAGTAVALGGKSSWWSRPFGSVLSPTALGFLTHDRGRLLPTTFHKESKEGRQEISPKEGTSTNCLPPECGEKPGGTVCITAPLSSLVLEGGDCVLLNFLFSPSKVPSLWGTSVNVNQAYSFFFFF